MNNANTNTNTGQNMSSTSMETASVHATAATTTMNAINVIIRANNFAALSLEEGRCEDAIRLFTESLAVSKSFLDETKERDHCPCCSLAAASRSTIPSRPNGTGDDAPPVVLALDDCVSSNPSLRFEGQDPDEKINRGHEYDHDHDHDHPHAAAAAQHRAHMQKQNQALKLVAQTDADFVYLSPLYLPASASVACGCRNNGIILAIVSIFNLALGHHVLAMNIASTEPSLSTELLEKSRRLYELAFQLYNDDSPDGERIEGGLVFLLATVNNLGMVHQRLGRSGPAHQCFQHVLSTMVFLIDQQQLGPSPAQLRGMTQHLWQRFLDNTHHLVKNTCSAAAA